MGEGDSVLGPNLESQLKLLNFDVLINLAVSGIFFYFEFGVGHRADLAESGTGTVVRPTSRKVAPKFMFHTSAASGQKTANIIKEKKLLNRRLNRVSFCYPPVIPAKAGIQ